MVDDRFTDYDGRLRVYIDIFLSLNRHINVCGSSISFSSNTFLKRITLENYHSVFILFFDFKLFADFKFKYKKHNLNSLCWRISQKMYFPFIRPPT